MTKQAVPRRPLTRVDEIREALSRIEDRVRRLPDPSVDGVDLLALLDSTDGQLRDLETANANVGAERARLESTWLTLQSRADPFLRQVGPTLADERSRRDEATLGPWWFLDVTQARSRNRRLARAALGALAFVALLGATWLAYQLLLAPPPEVQQALEHIAGGETLAERGDLVGALAEFETAASLIPADPEPLVWLGVLHQVSGNDSSAREAFAAARNLELEEWEFLFQRGMIRLQLGELEAAGEDAQAAVQAAPNWAYGYYLRASTAETAGDVYAAVEDYRLASDLASETGELELAAAAQVQLGLLIQYLPQDQVPSSDQAGE